MLWDKRKGSLKEKYLVKRRNQG